jgi:hypothetical protein
MTKREIIENEKLYTKSDLQPKAFYPIFQVKLGIFSTCQKRTFV